MVVEHKNIDGHNGFKLPLGYNLPFGYNLECDADLLIVRRSDGSFVAAFGAGNVDPFDVEWAVWEDADQ